MKIVDAEAADGGVGGLVLEMRSRHLRYFAPRNKFRWSYVGPIFPAVQSDPEQAIVGSSPDGIYIFEGGSQRVDNSALGPSFFVFRSQISQAGGDTRYFTRKIGADGLPGLAAIGCLK